MNDLFNRKDILTIATADQAVIGTKGFFGDNLEEIIDAVKRNKIRTLSDVDMLATYNFWSNEEMNYMFFLPLDKIKNKEPSYRPIKNIFNFLVPGLDTDCLTDKDIRIDDSDLKHFFENYEIKINGKFVPFGIKEE